MKKFQLLVVSILLNNVFQAVYAQPGFKVDFSKALNVGDNFVPPNKAKLMRSSEGTINWDMLDDKVIVLDFFETSCSSCIQSMPKLQQIQNSLGNKLKIFTVGWQDRASLEKFFNSNKFLKDNEVYLPVIYNDSYLKEKFPHKGVPHVVFIYKGKVMAITMSEHITEENILKLFDKGTISLPLKDDFGKGNLIKEGVNIPKKGGVWLSGYQEGVPYQSLIIKEDSLTGMVKTSFYNVSIYSAILFNWARVRKSDYIPRRERLVLNVKDPKKYDDIDKLGNSWYVENAISYERWDRVKRPDSLQARQVLSDLHSLLGIKSYKTMRNIECLILQPCTVVPSKSIESASLVSYENTSVLSTMIDVSYEFPPVVDKVNKNMKIRLAPYSNLVELNTQLRAYGIEAVPGIEEAEVLVIEEI